MIMNKGIQYLNSIEKFNVNPSLNRILHILNILGNPQHDLKSILVGGTNGKGSVASSIASILTTQGLRTGLYTSPHLIDVNERIKINGFNIHQLELNKALSKVQYAAEEHNIEPSYFEVLTAAAFYHFALESIDYCVLEVGMGGSWDATNVVNPELSVITNVSIDHTSFLGSTVAEIAKEKAGIIKSKVPVVTGCKEESLNHISSVASALESPIFIKDVDYSVIGNDTDNFIYSGMEWNFTDLRFSLKGKYQLDNVATAICALEALSSQRGVNINHESIFRGLLNTVHEGRFEMLSENPPVILDGAHNVAAASALRESLQTMFPNQKFVFLISMMKNKEHLDFVRQLIPIADKFITVDMQNTGSINAESLARLISVYFKNVEVQKDLKNALDKLFSLSLPACITGSLYLAGDVKSIVYESKKQAV